MKINNLIAAGCLLIGGASFLLGCVAGDSTGFQLGVVALVLAAVSASN